MLEDVNFAISPGEFVAVVGPSGCGKSTLLNVLAGIAAPTTGAIRVGGDSVADRRGVTSYMPQDSALMPWRRVIDNAVLALEIGGMDRRTARVRARDMMGLFGLRGFEDAHVWQLSGGMKQRVALMRTMLRERDIVLLDEPFGALDALTRSVMQDWLLRIWDRFGGVFVLVTHDIEEAILLSDRVLVMAARPGSILADIEVGLPRPRSHDVTLGAPFLGIKHTITSLLRAENLAAMRQQHDSLDIEGALFR